MICGMRPAFSIFLVLLFAGSAVCAAAEGRTALLRTLNTDSSEQKRLGALAELEKDGPLEASQISRSITDTSPSIRAAMIRIGAPLAASDPDLELRLIALAHDRSPEVQLQMLKTLPSLRHASAKAAYRKLLASARRSADASLKAYALAIAD